MNCPKCGERFENSPETDSRSEWTREEYFCHNCDRDFVLLTVFKEQSTLIENQSWEDYNPENEKKFIFNISLIGCGENKDEAWNTVVKELDGFDKSELSDLIIESIRCEGNFV